jgi:hypothetical protein
MAEAKNRELTLLVTAGILAAFAVVDYYLTPIAFRDHTGWPLAMAYGICIAQVTLIAAWAVFAPGNIVVRLPWSLLLGLTMWYLLACGLRRYAYGRYDGSHDAVVLGIVLLSSVTVLQIPLWIAKQAFRYRMLMPGEVPAPAGRGPVQFQLKHLLIGTFILSVALSPIRLVLPKESAGSLMPQYEWLVGILAGIVVNLLTTLPCLWGGFVSAGRVWWLGLAWAVYSFVIMTVGLAIADIFLGSNGAVYREFPLLQLLNFTQGLVVFAVMRIYRTLGFRVQRLPRAG